MSAPRLSICIPTYNFGRFIGATLESIVGQLSDEVEIVVLDGGSTDDTPAVVSEFRARYPQLRYERRDVRGGIDRDMARVVDLAAGEYCWLFSSDDLMRRGAIQQVLAWLQSGSDLYLCRHSNCLIDMTPIGDHPVLRSSAECTFDLGRAPERERYFALAETTEAFFSFMGSLIVRRSTWQSVPFNEGFASSCWGHVARLFELMMSHGLRVTYSPAVLLDRRGDNDSFSAAGMVNRYRLAIDGYQKIAATFVGAGTTLAFHVRRVLRNEFGFRPFMLARIRCRLSPQSEDGRALSALIAQTYVDAPVQGWLIRVMTMLVPTAAYSGLRQIYRFGRNAARSALAARS